MRISFIIDSLTPGGSQRQLLYLLRELTSKNIRCQVLYFYGKHHFAQRISELGVDIHHMGIRYKKICPAYISMLGKTIKRVRSFKADILQSFSPIPNTVAIICGMLTHIPVVAGERNVNIKMSIIARITRIILYRFPHCITCNSTAVGQWSRRYYLLPKGKTEVIVNGVDTAQVPLRKTRNDISLYTILTIATFKPKKGHIYLVRAIPEVIRQYKSVHFIFVGEGKERNKIEELSHRMNVRNFISFENNTHNVNHYYRKADIFCLSSLTEGMPNVIMEAMTYGLPIVATNVGGTGELIIHEQTGLLISPKQPKELASAIIRLLVDKQLKNKLSQNAKIHIKNFSIANCVNKYIELYKKVAASG